jgi:hypothetical protein
LHVKNQELVFEHGFLHLLKKLNENLSVLFRLRVCVQGARFVETQAHLELRASFCSAEQFSELILVRVQCLNKLFNQVATAKLDQAVELHVTMLYQGFLLSLSVFEGSRLTEKN